MYVTSKNLGRIFGQNFDHCFDGGNLMYVTSSDLGRFFIQNSDAFFGEFLKSFLPINSGTENIKIFDWRNRPNTSSD